MNTADHLIYMAKQIAANLDREPDPAAALEQHIRLYWDPRMKAALLDRDQAELSPVVRAAIQLLKTLPPPVHRP